MLKGSRKEKGGEGIPCFSDIKHVVTSSCHISHTVTHVYSASM